MKKRSKQNSVLLPSKQVRSPLSLKVYVEQLPEIEITEEMDVSKAMKDHFKEKVSKIDKNDFKVHAIVHDLDTTDRVINNKDNTVIWESSIEKPHAHIEIIILNGKHPRLSQIYSLLGIVWREQEDSILMTHGGVEICSSPSALALYLTHDTDEAIRDQKHQYSIDDIITNDLDSYKALRERYSYENMPKDWDSIAKMFFEWGYQLKDIDELDSKFSVKIKGKHLYDVAKKEFWKGVEKNIQDLPNVNRLCIFVKSPPGMGKTYFARNYLAKQQPTFVIDGGKTGKTDKLKVSDKTLVINDQYVENLINLADGYKTSTYKRVTGNGYFCGNTLVILSNREFDDYMGEEAHIPDENLEAIRDRFYICTIMDQKLIVLKPCVRGSVKDIEDREQRYTEFKKIMEFSLKEYVESGGDIDLLEYKQSIKEKYRKEREFLENDKPEHQAFRSDLLNEIPEIAGFKDIAQIRPDYSEFHIFNNCQLNHHANAKEAIKVVEKIYSIKVRYSDKSLLFDEDYIADGMMFS